MKLHPVLPKALYFLFFLSLGISSPYYSVLLSTLLPTSWIGWTMGILQGSFPPPFPFLLLPFTLNGVP